MEKTAKDTHSSSGTLLSRSVSEIIGKEVLIERLDRGEKLRIKFGIDPTSPNIHLGRAVALLKLRDFQRAGHQIVFIIGDFTGVIGDTSDKESERPMLTREAVSENLRSYFDQAGKLLDMSQVEKHYNSEWLARLTYQEIGEQADTFSVAEFIARENIAKRLAAGKRVSLREMLYPLMQGYDSVMIQSDVEIGGTDQRFNCLAGRKLQERFGQSPQSVVLLELIPGTDGRKMSSSWGNTINLTESAQTMFAKLMTVPDELIGTYFLHTTRLAERVIREILEAMANDTLNPRDAKLRLAKEVVHVYFDEAAADDAQQEWISTVSQHQLPADIREVEVPYEPATESLENLGALLVRLGFAESKSDARRKIEQGGVTLGDERMAVGMEGRLFSKSDHGKILKVGKKHFAKILIPEA